MVMMTDSRNRIHFVEIRMKHTESERFLIISSRLAADNQLTDAGSKNLQHVFTTWFPRVVYYDLTDDTERVHVVVQKGSMSRKNVFHTSFLRADDSVIKTMNYDEERVIGKRCEHYDQGKTRYDGQRDGLDFRHVYYNTTP